MYGHSRLLLTGAILGLAAVSPVRMVPRCQASPAPPSGERACVAELAQYCTKRQCTTTSAAQEAALSDWCGHVAGFRVERGICPGGIRFLRVGIACECNNLQ